MKLVLICMMLGLLASCASSPTQQKIRQYIVEQDFEKARSYIETSAIKKKKRNEFLYRLERGQLFFLEGKNLEATKEWEFASELLKDFYKKKTVDKVLNSIANNNYEDFQAEVFEQYQLFFQLSLAYIRLSQQEGVKGQQRSQYLFSARAAILGWDSFIKSVNRNKKLKTFYKDSFLARFWGSLVHEMIGSRNDMQIAYQLMKDALQIKTKNLQNLKIKFLNAQTQKLIETSLVRLAKKLGRRKELRKWESQFSLKHQNINLNPTIILLDRGLISFKKATRVPFSLNYTFNNPTSTLRSNLLGVGFSAFSDFSRSILGVGYYSPSRYERTSYINYNYQINGGAIDFELAVRQEKLREETLGLPALSLGSQNISKAFKPFVSLSQLSRAATDEDYETNYFKTGLRAAGKYLSAMIASYRVYQTSLAQQRAKAKSSQASNPALGLGSGGFARFRASTAFALTSALIRASEKADTRHWTSLPSELFLAEVSLQAGESETLTLNNQEIGLLKKKSQGLEIFSFSLPRLKPAK